MNFIETMDQDKLVVNIKKNWQLTIFITKVVLSESDCDGMHCPIMKKNIYYIVSGSKRERERKKDGKIEKYLRMKGLPRYFCGINTFSWRWG